MNTPNNLKDLYIKRRMTISEIARLFGVCSKTVSKWLRKNNLHYWQRNWGDKPRQPSLNQLRILYFKEGKSQLHISRLFHVSQVTVSHWIKNLGIPSGKNARHRLSATKRPTTLDIAWAAGFIEGEGSFVRKKVTAVQVNPQPVEKLKELFGGSLTYRTRVKPRQPYYRWQIHGARALGFAFTIYPFLSDKRKNQLRKELLCKVRRPD